MPGLETAAAVIGIADVAFKGVLALYDFLSKMQDAPDEVVRLRRETLTLSNALSSLKDVDLQGFGEDVRDRLRRICLADDVNDCGAACEALTVKLVKWNKGGDRQLLSRLQVAFHEKEIEKHTARIESTKGTTQLAVSAATLLIVAQRQFAWDQRDQKDAIIQNQQAEIVKLQEEARAAYEARGKQLQSFRDQIDPGDTTATEEKALENLEYAYVEAQKYRTSCETAAQELSTSKLLNQRIKDVISAESAKVWVGMPKDVVHLVEQQHIEGVITGKGAEAHVGIF